MLMSYPGTFTMARALLYSQMCGNNSENVHEQEFIAGCNRFALDNPAPTITSRIAFFGNEEPIEKKLKLFAEKLQIAIELFDPDTYATMYPGGKPERTVTGALAKLRYQLNVKDMHETLLPEQAKKIAGQLEMNMLHKKEELDKFSSQVDAVISQGVTIRIKDIPLKSKADVKAEKRFNMTELQVSTAGNKQIVVPSFGATGAVFARHFDVLKNLRRRLMLLQKAYEMQQDEKRSWEQVKEIIRVLTEGVKFLEFEEVGDGKNGSIYEDPSL